jgi:hypothetical protein
MRRYISGFVCGLVLAVPLVGYAQGPLQVSATSQPPPTTTNAHSVQFVNLNLFRYNIWPNVQDKTSNPPTPPAGFMPPAGGGAAAPAAAPAAIPGAKPAAAPAAAAATDPLQQLEADIANEETQLNIQTNATQVILSNAARATACFKALQGTYSQPLLTSPQVASLKSALSDPSSDCKAPLQQWPLSDITAAINLGPAISNLFVQLNVSTASDPGKTLLARHTDAQAGLQSLFTSSNASALATSITYIETWQQRATATLAASDTQWSPTVTLTCHPQWFGKTEQQTISIFYYDMTASAPIQQTTSSFTNSCLGSLTISSGIGISTVRSSTFAFTPQTNYSVSPPTTTQVIGYAADSRVVPVYLGAMNYEFAGKKSMGFDFAGGAGVGSSSAGTTSDFFIGPSFAFARRDIFVSPSFHLTQRQTLQDGYQVGDAQGTLTSVPTINRWHYGFAVTFTFPVLQSQ